MPHHNRPVDQESRVVGLQVLLLSFSITVQNFIKVSSIEHFAKYKTFLIL